MVTDKIRALEATRAKLAALESSVAAELKRELAALPATYGFATVAGFVAAVQAAAGKRRGRKPGKTKGTKANRGGRKKRAVITDATRAAVRKMVGDGKTGTEIATALKISLPSVQNVKKALGLVKNRK